MAFQSIDHNGPSNKFAAAVVLGKNFSFKKRTPRGWICRRLSRRFFKKNPEIIQCWGRSVEPVTCYHPEPKAIAHCPQVLERLAGGQKVPIFQSILASYFLTRLTENSRSLGFHQLPFFSHVCSRYFSSVCVRVCALSPGAHL